MWWFKKPNTEKEEDLLPASLQLHTIIQPPLGGLRGRIVCRPMGSHPINLEWSGPDGEVETNENGTEASNIRPGTYRIVATDATESRAEVTLDVESVLVDTAMIEGYEVTHASTSSSRDGSVRAVGEGLEGTRLLWTHGTETVGPDLVDVPCGTYAAVPIVGSEEGVQSSIHLCPPARVRVKAEDA
jgi:hypothetical protein